LRVISAKRDKEAFNLYVLTLQSYVSTLISIHVVYAVVLLARDAFVTCHNESSRHDVRPSVRLCVCLCVCVSETGVHCDHTVQRSADLSMWLG